MNEQRVRIQPAIRAGCVLTLLGCLAGCATGAAPAPTNAKGAAVTLRLDFEDIAPGQLPPGWKCEATHPAGAPNPWRVQADDRAASGRHVLALPETPRFQRGTFNLCWTDRVRFLDGVLEVKVRAGAGEVDQGGGLIWRARDADNYYVVRWNPLEDNFRLYRVVNGRRSQIASAEVQADPTRWHLIRVSHHGAEIVCWLDGRRLLAATDTTLTGPGGVGLWTKADAASAFDDFSVEVETRRR